MSGAVEGSSNVGKEPVLMRGPEATRVWEDAIKESLEKSRKAPSGFGWGFLFSTCVWIAVYLLFLL